ncbi:Kelch repeat-containing protein [Sphingobacterium siyangense]|uniref:Kelch repeat-containing protein n=1 Tax=Sphingobacterium siyangense TaxID=459529 RepID=UPI003DA446F2
MNKKNWLLVLLAFVLTATTLSSCKKSDDDDDDEDEWFQKAAYKGPQTSAAASFVIDKIAYVTTGLASRTNGTPFRIQNTYAYNATANTWSEKTAFPGVARNGAVGFTINNIGYVGAGNDGTNNLKDFYKYNPTSDTWEQIASLPIAVNTAVAFTLNGVAYVGTGETTTAGGTTATNEFYKYDPAKNTWEDVEDAPFTAKRKGAFAFVINNIAYVGGGLSNGSYPKDFYKFDGSKWTKLNDINRDDDSYTYNLARSNASSFVINGYAFVVGGSAGSVTNSIWKYYPNGDYWDNDNQVFQGSSRQDAVGFSIDGNGYITTGLNGSTRFDDTWMFTPIY